MALSYEYTMWHLTPSGWVSGDSKTDFNRWNIDSPADTVLSVEYSEKINNRIQLEKNVKRIFEIKNKEKIEELEKMFPFNGHIKVYS